MPRGIQTPDLQDRNLLLYSAELWTHKVKTQIDTFWFLNDLVGNYSNDFGGYLRKKE